MLETTPSIKFQLDLPIACSREDFTSPQKCHLPVEFFPASMAKSSMVICRSTKNRNYLCRLYSSGNLSPQNHCQMDKSVEILPSVMQNYFEYGKLASRDEERLQAIEMTNCLSAESFTELGVDVVIKTSTIDYGLLSSFEKLIKIVAEILRFFTFHENCLISTKELNNTFGITNIIVNSSSCESLQQLGTASETCKVQIDRIHFDNLTFSSTSRKCLGGLSNPITTLENFILLNKDFVLNTLKTKPSCQLLIIGPCGSGKTSLVENLANQYNCFMTTLKSHDVIRTYPGETENQLRKVFENVKKIMQTIGDKYLSIILIEDIEELCPKDVKGHDKTHICRISSQLKALLDDVTKTTKGLLIVATTSSIEQLDASVRRPGRFEQELLLPMPTEADRKEILAILLEAVGTIHSAFHERIVKFVAKRTHGYVGADLEVLLKHVGRKMAKQKVERQVLDEIIQIFLESLKVVRPTVLKDNLLGLISQELPSFQSIGGMEKVKRTLSVSVLGPLQRPEAFARFNMTPPKGVLFYGPPGCAKTTFAKCLAQESKMTFIAVSAAEIYSPYVGNAEKLIVKLFNQARMSSPAIIFLDEIDALVGNRTGAGSNPNPVQQRILSTLLTEMDGIGIAAQNAFVTNSAITNHILVIAATNRPDMIDNALMRPGRFDKLIYIPAPDEESRRQILDVVAKKMPFDADVDLEELAAVTERFSGADLCNLCNEAGLDAITSSFEATNIRMENFKNVLEYIRPSLTRDQIRWYDDYESQFSVV